MSVDITVPRELLSPNKWQGRHWRYKHKDSQEWEWHIMAAMGVSQRLRESDHKEPRRVTVTRIVPSTRNFIKDEDNLRFTTKPLNDALKRLGLITDDSQRLLIQPLPIQLVSSTGQYYTRIQIEAV